MAGVRTRNANPITVSPAPGNLQYCRCQEHMQQAGYCEMKGPQLQTLSPPGAAASLHRCDAFARALLPNLLALHHNQPTPDACPSLPPSPPPVVLRRLNPLPCRCPAAPQVEGYPDRSSIQAYLFANPDTVLAAVHFEVAPGGELEGFVLQTNTTVGRRGCVREACRGWGGGGGGLSILSNNERH